MAPPSGPSRSKAASTGAPADPLRSPTPPAATTSENLASFRDHDALTVPANDIGQLRHLYALAEEEGWFIEAFYMEPVMGEGNPGKAVTREFYDAAHALSRAHGSLLVVDSIQAGLRAHGCLSIVDYPGFEDAEDRRMSRPGPRRSTRANTPCRWWG